MGNRNKSSLLPECCLTLQQTWWLIFWQRTALVSSHIDRSGLCGGGIYSSSSQSDSNNVSNFTPSGFHSSTVKYGNTCKGTLLTVALAGPSYSQPYLRMIHSTTCKLVHIEKWWFPSWKGLLPYLRAYGTQYMYQIHLRGVEDSRSMGRFWEVGFGRFLFKNILFFKFPCFHYFWPVWAVFIQIRPTVSALQGFLSSKREQFFCSEVKLVILKSYYIKTLACIWIYGYMYVLHHEARPTQSHKRLRTQFWACKRSKSSAIKILSWMGLQQCLFFRGRSRNFNRLSRTHAWYSTNFDSFFFLKEKAIPTGWLVCRTVFGPFRSLSYENFRPFARRFGNFMVPNSQWDGLKWNQNWPAASVCTLSDAMAVTQMLLKGLDSGWTSPTTCSVNQKFRTDGYTSQMQLFLVTLP